MVGTQLCSQLAPNCALQFLWSLYLAMGLLRKSLRLNKVTRLGP